MIFFLMVLRPPMATRTDTLFPSTTLFRSPARFFAVRKTGRGGRDAHAPPPEPASRPWRLPPPPPMPILQPRPTDGPNRTSQRADSHAEPAEKRRPVRHLPRRPVPAERRAGGGEAARRCRLPGQRAGGADLLRPAALQFRRSRRCETDRPRRARQLGRASWRERVCQYV